VQLDPPSGATLNFTPGTSTFSTQLNGVPQHAKLGVQANVRGVDGSRTDIVSVTETAKLRPDLYISAITTTNAILGADVTIRAQIREANGDVGARTNARLYYEGRMIDGAQGIWVDAGGTVQVVFKQHFAHPDVQLTVVLADVDPGDWDTSNNSETLDLHLEDPPPAFYSWSASAKEETFDVSSYTKYDWGEFNRSEQGFSQLYSFTGMVRYQLDLTNLMAQVHITTDGLPLYDANQSDFWGSFEVWYGRCATTFSNPEVTVCWDQDRQYSTVEMSFGDGDAIYRSWGWATRMNPFSPEVPRYEWNTTTVESSARNRFGTSVAMDIDVNAGDQMLSAHPFMNINKTRTTKRDQPYGCFYDDFLNQTICSESHETRISRSGSASGF
jgi:hypothetical protein